MTGNVFRFRGRPLARVPECPTAPVAGEAWPAADLPDEAACAQWLEHAVAGTRHEATARSLWRNQPNLRASTEKLAGFITPRWPASAGGSLLAAAVDQALSRAQEAIDQGQAFEGRLVGVYLYGLLGATSDVARWVVRGHDAHGQIRQWAYFSQPLVAWARQHGMQCLLVQPVEAPPSEVVLSGLRTHMTARLTDPVDAGYLARHAAHG